MTLREIHEYQALRDTIRERGTARVWIFVIGLAIWGGSVMLTANFSSLPVATLLPLLLLAAVFEAIFALHTGVERVGRYLQVFYEGTADELAAKNWETSAMAFGRLHAGRGSDPLFATFFILAAGWNFVPAILAGALPIEWIVIGTAHLLFVGRILAAKRRARQQRSLDLDAFLKLKASDEPTRG